MASTTVVSLLLLLALCICAATANLTIEERLDQLNASVFFLHAYGQQVASYYIRAREIVVSVELYQNASEQLAPEFVRSVKDAEITSARAQIVIEAFHAEYVSHDTATDHFQSLRTGMTCSMEVSVALEDLVQTAQQIVMPGVLEYETQFWAVVQHIWQRRDLAANHSCGRPSACQWSLIVMTWLVVLYSGYSWYNERLQVRLERILLGGGVVAFVLCLILFCWMPTLRPNEMLFLQDNPDANHTLTEAAEAVTHHLDALVQYCHAINHFNATVLGRMMSFSKRVDEVIHSEGPDSPEVALQLAIQTREMLQEQRTKLEQLANSRRGSEKTDLDPLLNFVVAFEMYFSHMEMSLYTSMRVGMEMNRFFAEHMDILYHYVNQGKLVEYVSVLHEIHRAEMSSLAKLSQAHHLVRATNDAARKIRHESQRLKAPLESEQMLAWAKKLASNAGIGTGLLPILAAPLIPLPGLAVLPATVVSVAVVAIGYNMADRYGKDEAQANIAIIVNQGLDKTMAAIENYISTRERTVNVIMQDVEMAMNSVNKSIGMFHRINMRLPSGPDSKATDGSAELRMIGAGIGRSKESIERLSRRYQSAMDSLFHNILKSPEIAVPAVAFTRQLPSDLSVSEED